MANVKVKDLPTQATPVKADYSISDKASGSATEKITWEQARNIMYQPRTVYTQFDKAANTTLDNITGLTVDLLTGRTYKFRAQLFCTLDAIGGGKVTVAGTATAAIVKYEVKAFSSTGGTLTATKIVTSLGAAGTNIATGASTEVEIEGCLTCNGSGTLTIQFAQFAGSGTSSVLTVSNFEVTEFQTTP